MKMTNVYCKNVVIRRNVVNFMNRTGSKATWTKGVHHRIFRILPNKASKPLKCGIGGTTILGIYIAYITLIYGIQYKREMSRPFNARSTSDDVMKGIDLSGKYAIITGCNSGLGKETARAMVASGATIIMACRNLTKAEKAKNDIIATFDENLKESISKKLIIMQLDLGSLQSVYDFSNKFVKSGLKCDYLVNNAGIGAGPYYKTTVDNIERQFGVFISPIHPFIITSFVKSIHRKKQKQKI